MTSDRKAYHKVYRQSHREDRKAYNKAYRLAHLEEMKASQRAYYLAHQEGIKAYRLAHQEGIRGYQKVYRQDHQAEAKAYQKTYCQAHPEKAKAKGKAFRQVHPERIKAWDKAYYQAHLTEALMRSHKRRALKQGSVLGPVDWKFIKARDKMVCQICRKKVKLSELSFDHIQPISKGGAHTTSNLQVTHLHCNLARGTRGPAQMRLKESRG